MKSFLLLLIAALLGAAALNPRTTTALEGTVTDDTGQVLIGASVKVMRGADTVRGAVTNLDGNYRVVLEPGTYDLEVSYTGYTVSRTIGVVVLADKVNHLDIVMAPDVRLEAVVISVPSSEVRQEKSSAMTVQASGRGRKAAPKSKSLAPSTSAPTSADRQAIKFRGERETGTNYYLDGIRVSEAIPTDDKKDVRHIPDPDPVSGENYAAIVENPFLSATTNPVSTFSIDVDGAAYANLRRFLDDGQLPPSDAVRIEEMVNYFDYRYDQPAGAHPFAVHTELAPCPWNPQNRLLLIGLQGRSIDLGQLPPGNFVFLIDVSGSMNSPDKLPLVVESLKMLTDQLRPVDRVAIVVYAGAAGLVLPSTAGSDKAAIRASLEKLSAGGSTAGGAGIQLAYNVARANFLPNGNNRVVLCSDGDFNVGVSSESELIRLIETERTSGVYLSVLGFGTGNYQDAKMQQLAGKGNGNNAYIDNLQEAKKVLINEFGGTMFTIAKDVKLQLEFNPAQVAGYRLIGYENRLLAREDFNDDTKDAGELGAGHRVTALYEIEPAGTTMKTTGPGSSEAGCKVLVVDPGDTLRYQSALLTSRANSDELMNLKLRYKKPGGSGTSLLIESVVRNVGTPHGAISDNFHLASAVAEFGLLLRDSKYKGHATFSGALQRARKAAAHDPHGYRAELCRLIEKAWSLKEPLAAKK